MDHHQDQLAFLRIGQSLRCLRRILPIALLLMWVSPPAKAQCITSVYNSFWFAAPDVDASHGDEPLVIRVSAFEEDVAYRISMPSQPAFSSIQGIASAGSIRTIDLTPVKSLVETSTPDAVGNHGILVEVTGTGLPYFEVTHPNNPAILNLKGGLGLGTEFYTPFQNVFPNQSSKDGVSGFIITATRDATSITITPAVDMVGHTVVDGPFTINLDRGQTWMGQALGKDSADRLVGTRIQSSRPVAVTLYDDNIAPPSSSNYDLGADQLVPVGLAGLEHVVVAAAAGPREHAFIMATQDNTLLYVDSIPTPLDTLDAGEQYPFQLTGSAHFLHSDKPVHVLQLTGISGELGYSLLPPMTCTGLSKVGFYRTSSGSWRPVVIADSAAIDHFLVDGNPFQLLASEFSPVPGTNGRYLFSYADFTVTAGEEHLITNSGGNFHFGVVNNLGASCETGFYSWFGPSKPYLGADRVLCSNDLFPLTLRPNVVADSYLWNDGSTLDSLVINASGTYHVQASFGACGTSYDTVTIVLDTLPTVALTGDSVEASCFGGVATFDLTNPALTAGSDAGTITYHRSELGAQIQSDTIGDPTAVPPGVYWLRLTTECLCYSTRQITVWTDCIPELVDDIDTSNVDGTVQLNLLANDDDPYGNLDTGSVLLLDPVAGGTVHMDSAGWITYTPDLVYWLSQDTSTWQPDSFRYQACDGTGNCSSAWIYIEIINTWLGPLALDDSVLVNEDGAANWDVVGNDLNISATLDSASLAVVSGPANGAAAFLPDGTIGYSPDPDYFGPDVLEYVLCDTFGFCDTAVVFISVLPVNDLPLLGPDSLYTVEDSTATAIVLANDTDIDGFVDGASVGLVSPPANGNATVNPSGSISYTPDPDWFGIDSFSYQACDNESGCDTAWVIVAVAPVNDAPDPQDDVLLTAEDTPGTANVLANDTDIDSDLDSASLTIILQPVNGTASVLGSGVVQVSPDPDFNGTDSLRYRICDVEGACDSATLRIIVTPVNDGPIVLNDTVSTPEDVALDILVLDNDSDIDGFVDGSSVSILSPPANGSFILNPAGWLQYTPNAHYFGPDSFRYEVCDNGGLCGTAWVFIAVLDVNDAPAAVDDLLDVLEDSSATADVLVNDSDLDGSLDTASLTVLVSPINGVAVTDPTGGITYTPDPSFFGSDSLRYRICDDDGRCNTAWLFINVLPVNDPPFLVDDTASVLEDNSVVVDVLANDVDPDGTMDAGSLTVASIPLNGVVVLTGGLDIKYTPAPDYFGTDSFTYRACDDGGLCDTASVFITITPLAEAPVAINDTLSGSEDLSGTINPLLNDSDPDGDIDPTSLSILIGPSVGTVVLTGTTISFTPPADWSGTDSVQYQICDLTAACTTAWIVFIWAPAPDPPIAVDDMVFTDEDVAVVVNVADNDSDPEGDLDLTSIAVVSGPWHGSSASTATLGELLYSPDAGHFGSDSMVYRICDATGLCDSATVCIEIGEIPGIPVVQDDAASTEGDQPIGIDVLINDIPGDYPFELDSLEVFSPPANGSLDVDSTTGTITYTADFGFCGLDSFRYLIGDSLGNADTATVVVEVHCFPPEAVDDVRSILPGDSSLVAVLDNDYAGTGGWDSSGLAVLAWPVHGSLAFDSLSARYRYHPPAAPWCGEDSFQYLAANHYGFSDSAWVRIDVECQPFEARDDAAETQTGTSVQIDWLANDDADADPASFRISAPAENGLVLVSGTGILEYIPDEGFVGEECFTYLVDDLSGLRSDDARICVSVTDVLRLPILPEIFTPNGDGRNDVFAVDNLEYFPNASLAVFNRWENVVFEAEPYQNTWDGRNQATGRELPEGTYFFIFRFDATDPASPVIQRAVTLLR